MADLYRKEQYEVSRDVGDGEQGEDMVTYRTRFVLVEPCVHGFIDGHWYGQYRDTSKGDDREYRIWCEGAALEEDDDEE